MRPVRKMRRWFRSTPTTQVASTVIGAGCVLVLVAAGDPRRARRLDLTPTG